MWRADSLTRTLHVVGLERIFNMRQAQCLFAQSSDVADGDWPTAKHVFALRRINLLEGWFETRSYGGTRILLHRGYV